MSQEIILSTEERKQLETMFADKTPREVAQIISLWMRALEGQDVSGEDKITNLTNPKNIRERTVYPTYTTLFLSVYYYILHDVTGCPIYKRAADMLGEALMSYKGKSRDQYVDMVKVAQAPQQLFSIGGQTAETVQTVQKRGFLDRFRKPKSDEVEETLS